MQQKINILLALNVSFDAERGGLERSSVNLINYLSKQSSLQCFCAFTKFVTKIENIIEIETTIYSDNDLKVIITKHQIDIVLLPGGPWYTILADSAIKGTNCKIITAWHFSPGIMDGNTFQENLDYLKKANNKLNKLKSIVKLLIFPIRKYQLKYSNRKLFREAYHLSDAFVVLSNSFINQFKTIYQLPDISKISAISNSLSFEKIISEEEIQCKEKTILIVARFDENSKRISLALKIWKILEGKNPEWKLQLVGDGKDRAKYQSLVKRLQLKRVYFEGRQKPEKYYIKASIFFMTSRHEGWPLTLTEAQQMGCVPIVMNSFTSLHDIITNNENGFIVANKNINEFALKTQILIDNEKMRIAMALNAVKNSKRFTQDIIGKKWTELFQSLYPEKTN